MFKLKRRDRELESTKDELETVKYDRDLYKEVAERFADFERYHGLCSNRHYIIRTIEDADNHIKILELYISILESQRSADEITAARNMYKKLKSLKCDNKGD